MATPATILVCDDEDVLRALVRATLEGAGHRIVEARDGDEALEAVQRERPDLLVVDLMMPGRSGLEVVAEVRADDELADMSVIVLTARAQVADRDAAQRAGVDRYLAKPFSPAELTEVVEELLHARARV